MDTIIINEFRIKNKAQFLFSYQILLDKLFYNIQMSSNLAFNLLMTWISIQGQECLKSCYLTAKE